MPLVQTRGAASAQGFGEFAQVTAANYIEDVFSTYLYVGNGATGQSINNGIDLSGKGGLVWSKNTSGSTGAHVLYDTARGALRGIQTTGPQGEYVAPAGYELSAFNSNGFDLGANYVFEPNAVKNHVAWTFREQAKFFDIVTYTGNGTAGRNIAHNLGSVPGCMIIKRLNAADEWRVYHRSLGNTVHLNLNDTGAQNTGSSIWNSTTPTSTVFTVGNDSSVNGSGSTYVAYLFAHDAGGFGLTGLDNVISCGSATTNGSGLATVTLGYEPQWLLVRNVAGGNWLLTDNMRGWAVDTSGADNLRYLAAESLAIEAAGAGRNISSTGFNFTTGSTPSSTYIYIAIRRGPMKVPTLGTDVYNAVARTGTGATATVSTVGFPPDAALITSRNKVGTGTNNMFDRLRGAKLLVSTDATTAEITDATTVTGFDLMTGVYLGDGSSGRVNYAYGSTFINWFFRRAPSVFDIVCYTGTGSAMTVSHNLAAVPELMIVKRRNSVTYGEWFVYTAVLGNAKYQLLDTTQASTTASSGIWNLTTPTSTIMSVGSDLSFSASPYVAYLFATCAGVSKVFSYTGNGSSQTINCGFTGGSRFVMIKRTDATGDWYVWDSARGIVAGNDPHLSLNTTAAEVTTDDSVDTDNTGFVVNQLSATNVNVTSATYIGIAIA